MIKFTYNRSKKLPIWLNMPPNKKAIKTVMALIVMANFKPNSFIRTPTTERHGM